LTYFNVKPSSYYILEYLESEINDDDDDDSLRNQVSVNPFVWAHNWATL